MEKSTKISMASTKPSSFITEDNGYSTEIKEHPEDILFSASLEKLTIKPDLNNSKFLNISKEESSESLDDLFVDNIGTKVIEQIKDKEELNYLDSLVLDIKQYHTAGLLLKEEHADCLRKAPITVNFKLRNLLKYSEPRLKSPSKLNSDRGSNYMQTRIKIENEIFKIPTEHYDIKDPKSTPKYAAINVFNKKYGAASGYGANCFIFKDEIKKRCTVTTTDSFQVGSNQVRDYATITTLPLLPAQLMVLDAFVKSKSCNRNLDMSPYIEVQIHGNVDLRQMCEKIIISQEEFLDLPEADQDNIREKLQEWAISYEFK